MNTDVVIEVLEVGMITSVDVIGANPPALPEEEVLPAEQPDVFSPVG